MVIVPSAPAVFVLTVVHDVKFVEDCTTYVWLAPADSVNWMLVPASDAVHFAPPMTVVVSVID